MSRRLHLRAKFQNQLKKLVSIRGLTEKGEFVLSIALSVLVIAPG